MIQSEHGKNFINVYYIINRLFTTNPVDIFPLITEKR